MDETDRGGSDRQEWFAAGETFEGTERLLTAFSHTSDIGFTVLDVELRYQAINKPLIEINGIAGKAHLGVHVSEIFGELSRKIAEPHYHRVLTRGQISHFEVKNEVLPTRAGSRYWGMNSCFPIRDRAGKVRQIGFLVVEITQQRKLEELLSELAGKLRSPNAKESFWFAQKITDCIDRYYATLAMCFDALLRNSASSVELLTQSVVELDQRISFMRALVSEAAIYFPTDHRER